MNKYIYIACLWTAIITAFVGVGFGTGNWWLALAAVGVLVALNP